ncbi:hypothetical protein BGZ60DRAFT_533523 [Tricladium varicosporioides]|nr:hypothetical protein BGZ60DRAFT_533523 [Hymenoscyphus varicosporioides]
MDLLINTYFDRVHWFMLVFHQDVFRERFRTLVSRPDIQAANSNKDFSFACTVLIVTAMGLQYTCNYRKQRLAQLSVDPKTLLLELLSTIQTVFFDLVAVGSLESVQVCVLVGSFYLFHGYPGPALPIISCGLRIAQGMGLHRRQTSKFISEEYDKEEGNRCWLALFEIDRFCSMIYGLPISFANEDCDMELLVPSPLAIQPLHSQPTSIPLRNSILLFYKRHMAEFSTILTEILSKLYRPTPNCNKEHTAPTSSLRSQISSLSKKINYLDSKLRDWYRNVHPLLHLDGDAESKERAYASPEAMDQDIGGHGERFERHVLRMQAITIKFAFENAIIITHRPLLSFQSARSLQDENSQAPSGTKTPNPYRTAIETCRKAALNSAAIGSFSTFEEALDTYAASFVGIHIFTAGVVLCLIASFEPMTSQTHEAKAGIQKLMVMQRKLQGRSIIAAQGFEILQKVVSLVVERELQEMLGDVRSEGSMTRPRSDEAQHEHSSQNISDPVSIPDISNMGNCTIQDSQSGLRVGSSEQVDTQDSFLYQFQSAIDQGLLNQAPTDLASDENFIMDDYQYHLGDLSADIEQGWIWDPNWFVHM